MSHSLTNALPPQARHLVPEARPPRPPALPIPLPPRRTTRMVARRYELGARLGSGGMGVVWSGYDLLLDRVVALKELTGDRGRAAALQEARAAARITHHGVVRVIDVVLASHGRDWIVMELLPGRCLGTVVREDGPLDPARVRDLGIRLLEALSAVHSSGLVHGDVKPANVHLCDDGRVVITDFGLAQELSGDCAVITGIAEGSPSVLAPESIAEGRFGTASDLYALGVTLYMAATGESPFEETTPAAARRIGPLHAVIEALMHPDPQHRVSAPAALVALRRSRTIAPARRLSPEAALAAR
ncbi:serine/threonine-protein kinase [Kineosporia succinea]|uniref:non-specific serine/threonine protein kinase n=1 Tax=Kineosporia succinea TaxID=84632 RepID=A0ABT9PE41_9ACTN|nr:serine/threonine-protein kinase [Kineosporia succinea]MDP9830974.1 serine/threonine protein kinase [Kineosporia succinea]